MSTSRPKLAQELARRIVNTPGVTITNQEAAKTMMENIAFGLDPIGTDSRRLVLAALQAVVRDEQLWTALVAARAALGLPKPAGGAG